MVEKENALFNENPLFPFRIALQGVGDKKLFSLPETTVVFPGHGEKTTIGEEILYNPIRREL